TTTQTSTSTTSPPTTTTTQTSTSTTSPPTTTTTQTSTSTTTSSSTGSASSSQNGSVVLTILTRDTRGNVINGLYTVIQSSNGSTLATGYSPMVYNATSGEEYVISVENYHPYYFRHWDTGASTPSILIAPAQNTTLTAYYAVWNGWFNRITSEFAGLVQPSGMYTIVDLTMVVALFIISRYMFLRRH
ncbi:MAG: hypothetical protein JRN15_06830, partial [Nitrososphaerota archaeon]|nr:hypothetical protein [Nitrososphaerota archaeon]